MEAEAVGPTGRRESVRLLVDSGVTYTLLPEPVWKAIELTPQREMGFTLADGTVVQRQVSECYLALCQGEGHTPVILGEPGDEGLLGVVTLGILGLVLNPFTRTLHPMRALLMRMSQGHERLHTASGSKLKRIAMLKHGIDDIRLFYSNDLRFLRQF